MQDHRKIQSSNKIKKVHNEYIFELFKKEKKLYLVSLISKKKKVLILISNLFKKLNVKFVLNSGQVSHTRRRKSSADQKVVQLWDTSSNLAIIILKKKSVSNSVKKKKLKNCSGEWPFMPEWRKIPSGFVFSVF